LGRRAQGASLVEGGKRPHRINSTIAPRPDASDVAPSPGGVTRMKVSFTQKEYARLLELINFGMRTVLSRQGGEAPYVDRYADLEQKLLGLADDYGCGDMVDVGGDGKLIPSLKMEEDTVLRKIAGESDNDIFWHELIARLADRDLGVEQTLAALSGKGGPPINADARLKEIEDAYWVEFEGNDLAKVVVLRGGKE
jgi:hypothetical protein